MNTRSLQTASAYYQSVPGTRWLRWALGLSERVWPALAVRGALRLFGTPLPPKWLHRSQPALSTWHTEAWSFEDASLTLYQPPPGPHQPLVVLLHGWGGHASQMLPLAEALMRQGLRPLLVDLPAHGRSEGSTSNLPQFARAIEYLIARLRQQDHTVRGVVAHSLTANGLAYAAARGLPVERLVLLAPPASPHEYTQLFAKVFGLSEGTRARLQQRVEAREGILMRQFEPAAVGPRVALPTLIVHDREDRINRFADALAYRDAITSARLIETSGLGHTRLLRDEAVAAAVAAHISG
ncbi:alpha/beta hydrolase [Hydrogenophaga sp. BPS33]|uniref:alpha/beta hydrolase n=1 Tax=Hydrogenophaga sp. BPS33 TaxID=2651974 RepID=UPI00131FAF1F|nr:alpha/beta fold hydrolase [Hydrogenophaga sp. BPS33]QHE88509.1 alpha/beta hydrolase [Hydrogenophaga sp. BPS33]